ncbi:unnamed protein product [Prorocentrum cordatum]|uniref:Uncharacterized protein n=1 Tax=Prorocentrum cordatum TaxID=2364126 RepID=A0ABN9YJM4_9DINO|nr:unnamed protein product [Polarella glacialis]
MEDVDGCSIETGREDVETLDGAEDVASCAVKAKREDVATDNGAEDTAGRANDVTEDLQRAAAGREDTFPELGSSSAGHQGCDGQRNGKEHGDGSQVFPIFAHPRRQANNKSSHL